MDNERIVGGVFLALIFFGWFVWMISKVVARILHDLGIMFDAIGTASVSFIGMAWAIMKLIAVLSTGAAIVYAAYRHYQLVKEASDLLSSVDARCNEWANHIEVSQKELEEQVRKEVWFLHQKLAAALAKPEAVPEPPKAPAETLPAPPAPTDQPVTVEVAATRVSESDTTTPGVSNPY